MTEDEQKKLEKEANGLLAEARKLLGQAGKLAEKGKFTLSFFEHSFIPKSLAGCDTYEELSEEGQAAIEESGDWPREYQDFGCWWITSMC